MYLTLRDSEHIDLLKFEEITMGISFDNKCIHKFNEIEERVSESMPMFKSRYRDCMDNAKMFGFDLKHNRFLMTKYQEFVVKLFASILDIQLKSEKSKFQRKFDQLLEGQSELKSIFAKIGVDSASDLNEKRLEQLLNWSNY